MQMSSRSHFLDRAFPICVLGVYHALLEYVFQGSLLDLLLIFLSAPLSYTPHTINGNLTFVHQHAELCHDYCP